MSVLHRKLRRDLSSLRGQVVTICLVVASGIAGFIAMQTAYRTLYTERDAYYEAQRFGDVFASARRVPLRVVEDIRFLPGVAIAYPRIVESVRVPRADRVKVADGRIVSLPDRGEPPLNDVFLREGRMPELNRSDEVLLLEHFATVNGIRSGDKVDVVVNGKLRRVLVTGLAMSPEFVIAIGGDILSFTPGDYAVFWMRRAALAPAFDMEGAFNDIVVRLQPGASIAQVTADLDRLFKPYGAVGAYPRADHPSDHFVTAELDGLRVIVTVIPLIFLGVAAFLVNVVLGRLIELQRGQIATLKAVGYSNAAVGGHYLLLVVVIVSIGSALGITAGALLGDALLGAYTPYFRFPSFRTRFEGSLVGISVAISLLSAVAGAALAVRRIITMPPAEAMRPPAPPTYRRTVFDRVSRVLVGPLGRMVLREAQRQPARLLVSVTGISLAVAIMIIGRFASDSMAFLLDLQFEQSMHESLTVGLDGPAPDRVVQSMKALPGVTHAEGLRSVPVRFRLGTRTRESLIEGYPDHRRLRRVIDREGRDVALPLDGMLLTDVLADALGARPGDDITVELLEGDRRALSIPLAGTVEDMLGMQGYMRLAALDALLGQSPLVSTVLLSVDPSLIETVERRLFRMPAVAGVAQPRQSKANFTDTQGGTMLAMAVVLAIFAAIIAIGIVYNNARVTLSMRSRDLASMRVLGFSRAEVSTVLLAELALQVLLALPLGMWLGTVASEALLSTDPENFRLPAVISVATYTYAAMVTMAAALASGLLVRRKLDRLDLIGVLKTRE